jgi:hypothetical protein
MLQTGSEKAYRIRLLNCNKQRISKRRTNWTKATRKGRFGLRTSHN